MKIMKNRSASIFLAALLTILTGSIVTANASQVIRTNTTNAQKGCLVADTSKTIAGSGFNILVSAENCLKWDYDSKSKQYTTMINGKSYCLDVAGIASLDIPTSKGKGRQVMAWPFCHGKPNQQWFHEGKQLKAGTYDKGRENQCLNVDLRTHLKVGGKPARNVFVGPCTQKNYDHVTWTIK